MTNTTKQLSTTLNLLKKARAFVAAGWTKETAHAKIAPGVNQYCALGALNRAATGRVSATDLIPDKAEDAALRLAQVIARKQRVAQPRWYSNWFVPEVIVSFNDAEKRTQEQVLNVFDTAIDRVEKDLAKA